MSFQKIVPEDVLRIVSTLFQVLSLVSQIVLKVIFLKEISSLVTEIFFMTMFVTKGTKQIFDIVLFIWNKNIFNQILI